jgi:hypothetical protein
MKDKKVNDGMLDNLYLASPCSVPWDSMQGDDRSRVCGGCTRNVYNISDMTKSEAEKFLRCNGTNECMIFYRRQDGTILTDDCPVALRKIRDRYRLMMKCATAAIAFLLALPSSVAQNMTNNQKNLTRTAGKPSVLPHTRVIPNPAGGVRVLGESVISPPVPMPGAPAVIAPADPKAIVPGQVHSTQPIQQVKLHAEKNQYLNTKAYEFFKKGEEAVAKSEASLAEFYFEKALDAYDQQKAGGDAKFRQLIELALTKTRACGKHKRKP